MAITESGYLHIRKGNNSLLLLQGPDHFHLIRVDPGLSEAKILRLLRMYPCEDAQLRKLDIHFSAFKAANLCRVVVTGYQAGDRIELWLGGDVRKYQLDLDYSQQQLDDFFSGCPVAKQLPPEWEGLDPGLIRTMTWAANGFAVLCAIAFYFWRTPYPLWSTLCIFCQLTAFVLTLLFPASFTLADDSKKQKTYRDKRKGHLLPSCIITGFALSLRTLEDFTFPNRSAGILLLTSLILGILLCAFNIWLHKGLRDGLLNALAAIIVVTFLGFGTIGQLNYLLDFNPPRTQTAQVVDKQITRKSKSTDHSCIVQLPDGEFMEFSIPASTYSTIDIGENVVVTHHTGAFRIFFSTVETLINGKEPGGTLAVIPCPA